MSLYGNITNPINTQFVFDKIYPNKHLMDKKIDSDNIFYNKFVLVSYDEKPEFLEIEYTIDTNKSNYENNYGIDEKIEDNNNGLGWDKTVWQKTLIDGKSTYRKIATLNNQMPQIIIKADAPLGIGESLDNNWDYNLSEQSSLPVYNLSIPAPWKFALKDNKIEYFQDKFDPKTAISEKDEDKLNNTFNFESKVSVIKEEENGNKNIYYEDPSGEKKADTQLLTINLPSIGNAIAKVWEHLYGEIPEGQERILKIRPSLISPDLEGDPYNSISEGESVASVINQAYDIIGQKLIKVYPNKNIPSDELNSKTIYYITEENSFYRYNLRDKEKILTMIGKDDKIFSLLNMLLIFYQEIDNLRYSQEVYKIIDSETGFTGSSLIGIDFGKIITADIRESYNSNQYYYINDEKYILINDEFQPENIQQIYEIKKEDFIAQNIKFVDENKYYVYNEIDTYTLINNQTNLLEINNYYSPDIKWSYSPKTYYIENNGLLQLDLGPFDSNKIYYNAKPTLSHYYGPDYEINPNRYFILNDETNFVPIDTYDATQTIYYKTNEENYKKVNSFFMYPNNLNSLYRFVSSGQYQKITNTDPFDASYEYYQISLSSAPHFNPDKCYYYIKTENKYIKYSINSQESSDLIYQIDTWQNYNIPLKNYKKDTYYYIFNENYYQLDFNENFTTGREYYDISGINQKTQILFFEPNKYYKYNDVLQEYELILTYDSSIKNYYKKSITLKEIQLNSSADEDSSNIDIVITENLNDESINKQINIAHRKIDPQKSSSTLNLTPTGFEIKSGTKESIGNAKLILENNDNGHIVSYSDSFQLDVPKFKKSLEIQKKILSAELKIDDESKAIWKIQHNALIGFISDRTRQEILPDKSIDSASLEELRSLDLQEPEKESFDEVNGIIYLKANGKLSNIDDIKSKVFKVRVIIENGYDVIEEE